MNILHHNLQVIARRMQMSLVITEAGAARAVALAKQHELPCNSRSTAFALVALKKLEPEIGELLTVSEANVVLTTLAQAHDLCVLDNNDTMTVVMYNTLRLCSEHNLSEGTTLRLQVLAVRMVPVIVAYALVRIAEKLPKRNMADAILGNLRPKANLYIPGIDDDEDDLIKLGYM